jgi:hypothetical protein
MLQIDFPKIESNIYSLYNDEVEYLSNIELKEKYNKDVDLLFDDVNDILFKPNYREGFTDSWYLQINEDIVLITFSRTELLGKYKKLTISTNNIENEDLELILNYFLFLNKGYSNLLEDKSNSELLSIVDNYFNNDVWFDLAFDIDSETKLPYNEVLREFLEEKILSEVSLHELISDGYIKLDY